MDSSDLTRSAVWEKINGCSFGVYLPEEIRDISVKEITNIRNFDKMGEQVENGLYDPSLGPLSDFALCKTCKQRINHCPGHLGHIELKFMLYNPVLFNGLIRMLKLACLYCNKWRVGNDEIKTFYNKMEMIEKGELLKAQYYKTTKSVILDEFLKEENPVLEKNSKFQNNFTNEEKAIFRKIVVKEFYKQSTNKKCKNCDCINPTFENKNSTLVFKKLKTKQYNHNEELMEGKVIPEFLAENKDKEIMAIELRPYLKKFWKQNQKILSLFCGVLTNSFSKNFKGFDTFFITTLLVSPSKYRPINIIGNETLDNEKTICLEKIMLCNQKFVKLIKNFNKNGQNFSKKRKENNVKVEINLENGVKTENLNNKKNLENDSKPNFQNLAKIEKKAKNIILEAQSLVDDLFNSKNSGKFGVKQIIEKKTGIIRGNLMGKRVNYAARSIVSPDLWIESTEIGVPENFAKKLTFPESVTEQNIAFLKRSIENGPLVHPGANFIEDQNGYLIDLEMKSKQERKIMAGALTATQSGISDKKNISSILTSKRVYRHLDEKDYVLVNRQPTLHKASMMAHKVRILTSQDQVLRLHYTNCSTYNADFDGDEINMHFPQTKLAQSELRLIATTHRQYLSPNNTEPLRGLVQDHICAALLLSQRDTFFLKEKCQQYLYIALSLQELEKSDSVANTIVAPCVLKPKVLWSGKQILSSLLNQVSGNNQKLNLDSNSKISISSYSDKSINDEFIKRVIIRNNEWLTGVCDKSQIGATKFGVISAVSELYGTKASDKLLTKLGKLLTTFLQDRGLTAGPSDLVLKEKSEKIRSDNRKNSEKFKSQIASDFCGLKGKNFSRSEMTRILKKKLSKPTGEDQLDRKMKSLLNPISSRVVDKIFPHGMLKRFPNNNFALMVLSGGKGSSVNISQISALLGQQELEGRRVPRMRTGKTLPAFGAFGLGAEEGGYIADRFLTGINPKVYFFHCMAGREGLVDTAVKTARSGYLQRCVVKNMENVQVRYDQTVRGQNDCVLQFYYGEDGLDPVKAAYLKNFDFVRLNHIAYSNQIGEKDIYHVNVEAVNDYYEKSGIIKRKKIKMSNKDPVMSKLNYLKNLGCVSEDFSRNLERYVHSDKFKKSRKDCNAERMRLIMYFKYLFSYADPGESVGIIAGQSIGEPSTQMTLNTFHLAGHGGANVTLGIPRLREILMTSSGNIKTPTMDFGFIGNSLRPELGRKFVVKFSTLYFSSIIKSVTCLEKTGKSFRRFSISINLLNFANKIKWETLKRKITRSFVQLLLIELEKIVSKSAFNDDIFRSKSRKGHEENKIDDAETFFIDESGDKIDDETDEDTEIEFEGDVERGNRKMEKSDDSISSESFDVEENDESEETNEMKKRKANDRFLEKIIFEKKKNRVTIKIKMSSEIRSKIFMQQTIRKLATTFKLRATSGIKNCHVLKTRFKKDQFETRIQTEGVNFIALYKAQNFVDVDSIRCNDIVAVLRSYGIEACRFAVIEQIRAVFDVYGISIDPRHLALVAEALTWDGDLRAFNRGDLSQSESTLLKMSFESGISFLQEAILSGEREEVCSHSARLVLGQTPLVGTGSFELLQKLDLRDGSRH